ncbi:hexameric tyrosine-coordinated heme protein [Pseudovibrio denitrificans]|uniref:hexameric tyrosine-coordinated heme protein n=1 Tax=Pseudovibrio denitrificans TaxID=258256 RepID=UPI0039BFB0CB
MDENWLPTLQTATPEEGYALAVKLSRMAIKFMQPDAEVRSAMRLMYEYNSEALIAASQTVAEHFSTIAAANNYWK